MGTLQVELGLGQCRDGQLHVGLGQHQTRLITHQVGLGHRHVGAGFLPLFTGNR
ncbi:hypothetical protein D3C81_1842200 [compost metagenome]